MSGSSSMTREAVQKQTFLELAKAEKSGDYERALKAANRILKWQQHDETAFKCRLVCLIQLSKFEEVLNQLRKTIPRLQSACLFEKAYSEYRLNRPEQALQTLEALADSSDLSILELKAQLLYKLERYQECYDLFRKILKESEDDDDLRRVNLQAVEVHLADQLSGMTFSSDTLSEGSSWEQMFNSACARIAEGDFKAAVKLLKRAKVSCRELLAEDGCSEEEIEDEMASIRVQMAFCHQMLQQLEEATKEYQAVIRQKPTDASLVAVASNNLLSLRKGEQNLFDTRKKLKACQAAGMDLKLSPVQKRAVCYNNALLQLLSNQFELCRRALEELRTKFGDEESAALVEASLLVRQKETQKAVELLRRFKEDKTQVSDHINFALVQLELADGKTSAALKLLSEMPEVRWSPGVVSLVVALNKNMEDTSAASAALEEAIQHYRSKEPESPHLGTLVEQAASLCAKSGRNEAAAEYLEELRRLKPGDRRVLGRLIQTYSLFDAKKAEAVTRELPEPATMDMGELDLDQLEASDWLLLGDRYRQKKEAKHTPKPGLEEEIRKKRKRKRKTKLPKNYDPKLPPDPERWLPKYERSTFKKKKKAKDQIGKGTQGAVTVGNEMETGAKPKEETPASPKPTPAPAGPRQQRPTAQAKAKKKKKGVKW